MYIQERLCRYLNWDQAAREETFYFFFNTLFILRNTMYSFGDVVNADVYRAEMGSSRVM